MTDPNVIKLKNGMHQRARYTALRRIKITLLVKKKMIAPNTPAMPGAITHARNTCEAPCHPQLTLSMPTEAVAVPIRPPITLCVVEIGMPYRVATVRKTDDAMMVHIMARSSTCGESAKRRGSTMRVRMVSATRLPTATLPENSQTEAMAMACFSVRDREDTELAKELATSLAPVQWYYMLDLAGRAVLSGATAVHTNVPSI